MGFTAGGTPMEPKTLPMKKKYVNQLDMWDTLVRSRQTFLNYSSDILVEDLWDLDEFGRVL